MKSANNKEKIAITIPTGRPSVKDVVKSFLKNAQQYGYDLKQFTIYLSIDLEYQQTKKEDFIFDSEFTQKVNGIEYLFEEERREFSQKVIEKSNIDRETAETLFVGRGYSKQRNVAILKAAEDGQQFAICFDDDEAPYVPVKDSEENLEWAYPDYFTPHLESLRNDVDITRGPCLGYLSPIPSDFESSIPETIRKQLGEALAPGSEVITEDSFSNIMSKLRYLSKSELKNPIRPFNVEEGTHGKQILSGNMGINLDSVRNGKIPIFFTPKNARGEDTIFALQLRDTVVHEVHSYIFHDPFQVYPEILEGKTPDSLMSIKVDEDSKKRFASALIGWLKYAPILIAMTSKEKDHIERRISRMIEKIEEPTRKLAELLEYEQLNRCKEILQEYSNNVERDIKELILIQKEWREKIAPSLNKQAEVLVS